MSTLKKIAIPLIIMITLSCVYTFTRPEPKEFEFCQNYTVIGGGEVTTSLRIIVNVTDYNIEEMFEKIKDEYIEMEGEPNVLEIRLYKSRSDLLTPNYIKKKFYKRNAECSDVIK